MKILYKLVLVLIFLSLSSCSKDEKEISLIKEIDQELEMISTYREGFESLKNGDPYLAAKNLLNLKCFTHNQFGLQNQQSWHLIRIIFKITMLKQLQV